MQDPTYARSDACRIRCKTRCVQDSMQTPTHARLDARSDACRTRCKIRRMQYSMQDPAHARVDAELDPYRTRPLQDSTRVSCTAKGRRLESSMQIELNYRLTSRWAARRARRDTAFEMISQGRTEDMELKKCDAWECSLSRLLTGSLVQFKERSNAGNS